MVSNGSESVGAAKITGELLDIVIRMPQAMEQLTGVDITKVIKIVFFDFTYAYKYQFEPSSFKMNFKQGSII